LGVMFAKVPWNTKKKGSKEKIDLTLERTSSKKHQLETMHALESRKLH